MVYKLANLCDMESLPSMDQKTWDTLHELTRILTDEYGADRDVETSDGGYVLYAEPGTTAEELKAWFDYTAYPVECVNRELRAVPPICNAVHLFNNEYAVVIVMSIDDAPTEYKEEF